MIRLVTLLLATQLTAVWGWVRPTLLNRLPSHLQGATFTSRPTGLQTPVSEWDETISAIASRYVESKYAACDKDGENCVALRDRDEITVLLREILPPVSTSELNKEVDDLMKLFGDEKSIAIDKFVEAVKNNPYWGEAVRDSCAVAYMLQQKPLPPPPGCFVCPRCLMHPSRASWL